jgi:hypothetical protein
VRGELSTFSPKLLENPFLWHTVQSGEENLETIAHSIPELLIPKAPH